MNYVDSALLHISRLIRASGKDQNANDFARTTLIWAVVLFASSWYVLDKVFFFWQPIGGAIVISVSFSFLYYLMLFMDAQKRINQLEEALPEFMSVMASHIRSGQTYEVALLLSARKEFGPLAIEIEKVAKETVTGTPLTEALMNLSHRVPSKTFSSTIKLLVKGINSGGKLADLLETTALDIRRFSGIKKEVSATVLVYQLFSFAASCIGAPMLYAITVFLVRVFAAARGKMHVGSMSSIPTDLPFFQGTPISPEVTFGFSIGALLITAIFGSFAAGVIGKGKESEGLPYLPAVLVISFGTFFLISYLLQTFLAGVFFK